MPLPRSTLIKEVKAKFLTILSFLGVFTVTAGLPSLSIAENLNAAKSFTGKQKAQNQGDWDVSLGAGAIVSPEYEGGEDYEVLPIPYIDVKYKDRVSFNPFSGLRFNALANENIKAGVGLGADFGRDEDDADRLRGLGDIDPTVEGLLFAEYTMGKASAGVTFAQDLGDGHEGYTIEAEAGYMFPLMQYNTFIRPSISTTYAGDDYMQSFFGVDNAQSVRSGLNNFDAEAGFKDVAVNLFASYKVTENWAVNGILQYKQLLGDAADSPIVEEEGQITGGTFVSYKF